MLSPCLREVCQPLGSAYATRLGFAPGALYQHMIPAETCGPFSNIAPRRHRQAIEDSLEVVIGYFVWPE